jgi:hypothetical protein
VYSVLLLDKSMLYKHRSTTASSFQSSKSYSFGPSSSSPHPACAWAGSLSGGGGQSAPLGLARKSCRPVDLEMGRSQQIPVEPFNLMQPLGVAPSSQVPPALSPSASLPCFSQSFAEVVRSSASPLAQPRGRKVHFNL